MKLYRYIYFLILFLISISYTDGQTIRNKSIDIKPGDTIILDTLPIIPHSLKIYTSDTLFLENTDYKIEFESSRIIWMSDFQGRITIIYHVWGELLFRKYSRKSPQIMGEPNMAFINPFSYRPDNSNLITEDDGLDMTGSLSRGLGIGNNQNLVVNSNLNLQIKGKLKNDIDITALVSDDNNPIQPEGNTQQLQDFDKVYITLSKNKTQFTAGDYEMYRTNGSYFLKYYKKSRGLQASHSQQLKKGINMKWTGEGAMSRGRFARNILSVIEGNQGPYRLKGANGEVFIIIIAGTENIYMDGEKLNRGEQNDYNIDYNTGEITFMPSRVITRYTRIVAEFQYSDRNYARSVFTASQTIEVWRKLNIYSYYFSEQDHKNQPFLRQLSDSDIHILGLAGDNYNKAVVPTETKQEGFNRYGLNYIKKDTLYAGNLYNIYTFVFSQGTDTIFYNVTFSNVGLGRGNYRIAQSGANGRVFEWVAPVNGLPAGDYEPVLQLVTPKRKQFLTNIVEWNTDSFSTFTAEAALSVNNKNTFSTLDHNNDYGTASRVKYERNADTSKVWQFGVIAGFEYTSTNFNPIERFRSVEFDRTWQRIIQNPDRADSSFSERIGKIGFITGYKNIFHVSNLTEYYKKSGIMEGFRNIYNINFTVRNYKLEFSDEISRIEGTYSSQKIRQINSIITRRWKKITLFGSVNRENVELKSNYTDSIITGAFNYIQYKCGINRKINQETYSTITFYSRRDELPIHGKFIQSSLAHNVQGEINYKSPTGRRLQMIANWRVFEGSQDFNIRSDNSLLIRIDGEWHSRNRMITWISYYQTSSGQELKRQFSYLEVLPGNGLYQWNDYNGDSIQQLNEFEPAVFKDKARYIRIFQPTTDYVGTTALQVNQTVTINPGVSGKNNTLLKRFYLVGTFRNDRKLYAGSHSINIYTPFNRNMEDTSLVSMQSQSRVNLFFNRTHAVFGADIAYNEIQSRLFLTNGVDGRKRNEIVLNSRLNIKSSIYIQLLCSLGYKNYLSAYFNNRNFWYDVTAIQPRINFQSKNDFRVTLLYTRFSALSRIQFGKEKANISETAAELRYGFKDNGLLTGKLSWSKVKFTGEINSPVAFDMLTGLTQGNNYIWEFTWMQRLKNNIQVSSSYNGRLLPGGPVVHTGRIEARYLF